MEMTWSWLYPTSVSAFLIFVGWNVVYNNAKKLASRSETYAIVSRLITLLSEIQKLSEEFWLKAEFNTQPQNYDLLILSKIKLISSKLETLKSRNIDIYEIQKLVFPLRKACTIKSFEINDLSEISKREQVNTILQAISAIENKIDIKMRALFPPNY